MQSIEQQLKGGHHNSLGNTDEVVQHVLSKHELFDELFNCYFSDDELVRLRVSSAMKRIAKDTPHLLYPYLDRFLTEIAQIDQASTQWTLAQLFLILEAKFTDKQREKAQAILENNLMHHSDWIVLNTTMETLGIWAKNDLQLKIWLIPQLENLTKDSRKSVAKRATKLKLELKA